MPFYFFGVFENITKVQKEEKIKVEFKGKFLCPYGCRRCHKPNQEEGLEKIFGVQKKIASYMILRKESAHSPTPMTMKCTGQSFGQ